MLVINTGKRSGEELHLCMVGLSWALLLHNFCPFSRRRPPAGLLGYKFSVREGELMIRKFDVANIKREN
jgi:hypothetical protein